MSREPHGDHCGTGRFRHRARMLYTILIMLLMTAVAFPTAPVARGVEVDSSDAVLLRQTQVGSSAVDAELEDIAGTELDSTVPCNGRGARMT